MLLAVLLSGAYRLHGERVGVLADFVEDVFSGFGVCLNKLEGVRERRGVEQVTLFLHLVTEDRLIEDGCQHLVLLRDEVVTRVLVNVFLHSIIF